MSEDAVKPTTVVDQERALAAAFATRVRTLRREKGLTQEALAMAAGLTMSSLYRIESRKINLALIQRLCRALEVTHGELLNGLPQITERWTRASRTSTPAARGGVRHNANTGRHRRDAN